MFTIVCPYEEAHRCLDLDLPTRIRIQVLSVAVSLDRFISTRASELLKI